MAAFIAGTGNNAHVATQSLAAMNADLVSGVAHASFHAVRQVELVVSGATLFCVAILRGAEKVAVSWSMVMEKLPGRKALVEAVHGL